MTCISSLPYHHHITLDHHLARTNNTLSAARARELLAYDRETGELRHRVRRKGIVAGARAGCVRRDGYRQISVDGECYREHRVIWLMETGAWPPSEIDHRDLDGLNNRWSNLRPASPSQNKANQGVPVHNRSGYKGVAPHKQTGRWQSNISCAGVHHHLGLFATPQAAHAAYVAAATRLYGEFARIN